MINISQPCLATTRAYKYGQYGYPDYLENTGNFSMPGQFYLDRKKGILLATLLHQHTPTLQTSGAVLPVVVGFQETLLNVHDTHDLEWHNMSSAHPYTANVR